MVAAIISPVSERVELVRWPRFQDAKRFQERKKLTCRRVATGRARRAVRARVRVVRQTVVLRVACLVLLRIRVRARVLLLRLLLGRGLAVMLLVNNARGSRVLQMGGDRTLLLVVGVVLHRGDNH